MRLLAASIVVLTGCSAVVDDGPSEGLSGELSEDVRATVSVQRTDMHRADTTVQVTHVAARFLRTGGVDESIVDRVTDNGGVDATAPLGCSWRDDDVVASAEGRIELLDVGDIVLHTEDAARADAAMALAPRAFPDVGGLISGVVYTSRDGRAELPDDTTYLFEVTGSAPTAGFSIQAEAPAAPRNVRLSGIAISNGDLELPAGDSILITWSTESDALVGDRVYVTASDGADGEAFTCVFDDQGRGVIPSRFTGFAPGAELDVMVHRFRRAAVTVPGETYDAVVDFDFAVAAQAVVAD